MADMNKKSDVMGQGKQEPGADVIGRGKQMAPDTDVMPDEGNQKMTEAKDKAEGFGENMRK
jgi:hypothetical protein